MEKEKIRVIVAAAFVALLAYAALSAREQQWNAVAPWYDAVVTPDEVRAAQWVDAALPHWRLFAADLFSCEMLTAVARQHCSIGGAWELADRANDRYWSNQLVFTTNSSREGWSEAKKWGIEFVLVADRNSFYAYGWKRPNAQNFEDAKFFKKIYDKGDTKIYEVA
ncbi:MAG: hypothetical protein QW343_02210 [Candidatus Norongarragalinales archaeon]